MFHGWDNFYLMIGSAAGALIGLLFVVMPLASGFDRSRTMKAIGIYMTPNALHFAVTLVICATALAPGLGRGLTAAVVALATLVGLINAGRSILGIRELSRGEDKPHWTDFWCYGVMPLGVYLGLGGVATGLWIGAAWASNALAATLLALLLLGVRNAWDLVTWMAPLKAEIEKRDRTTAAPPA